MEKRIINHNSSFPKPLFQIVQMTIEALRGGYFVNEEQRFLINEYLVDFLLILLLFKKNKPENLFLKARMTKSGLILKKNIQPQQKKT